MYFQPIQWYDRAETQMFQSLKYLDLKEIPRLMHLFPLYNHGHKIKTTIQEASVLLKSLIHKFTSTCSDIPLSDTSSVSTILTECTYLLNNS